MEENPALESGEIHVWRAFLSVDQSLLRHLESTFAEDEKARAARFIFDRDRDHYIAARGILRDLLSGYIGVRPKRSNSRTVRAASPHWPIRIQNRTYALIFRIRTVSH